METNTYEAPNSIDPNNASVENLSFFFGNLPMMTRPENNQEGTSLVNSPFGLPINGSSTRNRQPQVDVKPNYGMGFKNLLSVPMQLYPENIWSSHCSSSRGNFLGSNLQSMAGSSMGSTNSTYGYGNYYQQNNFDGNLSGNVISLNSGFGTPSTSNWANQGNSFGDYAASMSRGASNYMFNNNLDLNRTIASQNSSQSDAFGLTGNSLGNSSGLRNQQSLNYVGFHGTNVLESLQGYDMVKLAKTQNGSLYLQIVLTTKDLNFMFTDKVNKIIKGVLESIYELLVDQYGHHLFGKLVESCNEHQLQLIVAKMTSQRESLIEASLNRYGSTSIKRLIKVLQNSSLVSDVTSILSSAFYELMTCRIGSHVIVKCLNLLDTQQNESLYKAAIKHCIELATHEKGCIALNNAIKYIKGPHRKQLLDLISSHAVYLAQDPSGNYVVQEVLELEHPVFTKKICSLLKGHYIRLSLLKGGSHVVEKCLDSSEREDVVMELLYSGQILHVARDPFGNYVINKALKVTEHVSSPLHQILLRVLKTNSDALKSGHGNHVSKFIESRVPNLQLVD